MQRLLKSPDSRSGRAQSGCSPFFGGGGGDASRRVASPRKGSVEFRGRRFGPGPPLPLPSRASALRMRPSWSAWLSGGGSLPSRGGRLSMRAAPATQTATRHIAAAVADVVVVVVLSHQVEPCCRRDSAFRAPRSTTTATFAVSSLLV